MIKLYRPTLGMTLKGGYKVPVLGELHASILGVRIPMWLANKFVHRHRWELEPAETMGASMLFRVFDELIEQKLQCHPDVAIAKAALRDAMRRVASGEQR